MQRTEVDDLRPMVLDELLELERRGVTEQISHQRGAERNTLMAFGLIEMAKLPGDKEGEFKTVIRLTEQGLEVARKARELNQ